MQYRGWIPTVNGRLSFRIIGESSYPNLTNYANVHTETHQYIVAHQLRNLSDVLFDQFLSAAFGVSGKFEFFFCGRSRRANGKPDARLVGKLFFIRKECPGYRELSAKISRSLRIIRRAELTSDWPTIKAEYVEAHSLLDQNCDVKADFALQRNGMCAISRVTWNDNEFGRNSIEFESENNIDLEHCIADQLYFFMRDITHQHQHHSPDADTIITTYKSGGDNLDWCVNIVYALYYYIINIKRRSDPIEHVRVLGVLAYLQSFKWIVSLREGETGKIAYIPEFNDESARESITATKNYIELLATRKKQASDEFRTVLFTISAISLTLISFISGFAEPEVETLTWVTGVANFLKINAYLCGAPLVVILVWLLSNKLMRPRYDFKRDVIRISIANRRVAFITLLLIGAGVLLLGGWLGRTALNSLRGAAG